jgi:hypothetical protein
MFLGMDGDYDSAPIHSWVDLLSQDDDDNDFVVKEKEKSDSQKVWTFEPKKDLPKKDYSEIWSEESPPRFSLPVDRVDLQPSLSNRSLLDSNTYGLESNRSLLVSNTYGLEYTMALRAGKI